MEYNISRRDAERKLTEGLRKTGLFAYYVGEAYERDYEVGCENATKWYETAIKAYDAVLQRYPEQAEAWAQKGDCLCKLHEWEQALLCYNQALEKGLTHPDAKVNVHTNKGAVLVRLGKLQEALPCFEKYLELASPSEPLTTRVRQEVRDIRATIKVQDALARGESLANQDAKDIAGYISISPRLPAAKHER